MAPTHSPARTTLRFSLILSTLYLTSHLFHPTPQPSTPIIEPIISEITTAPLKTFSFNDDARHYQCEKISEEELAADRANGNVIASLPKCDLKFQDPEAKRAVLDAMSLAFSSTPSSPAGIASSSELKVDMPEEGGEVAMGAEAKLNDDAVDLVGMLNELWDTVQEYRKEQDRVYNAALGEEAPGTATSIFPLKPNHNPLRSCHPEDEAETCPICQRLAAKDARVPSNPSPSLAAAESTPTTTTIPTRILQYIEQKLDLAADRAEALKSRLRREVSSLQFPDALEYPKAFAKWLTPNLHRRLEERRRERMKKFDGAVVFEQPSSPLLLLDPPSSLSVSEFFSEWLFFGAGSSSPDYDETDTAATWNVGAKLSAAYNAEKRVLEGKGQEEMESKSLHSIRPASFFFATPEEVDLEVQRLLRLEEFEGKYQEWYRELLGEWAEEERDGDFDWDRGEGEGARHVELMRREREKG